ncbi:hypothetical protein ACGFIW_20290 [Micromonospora sp. NPDC048935]|uniref:hypothetical protein n=1 Tax=Micromonospora sp. NPDC048935 TaxID=3364262 RepID=UPI0037230FB5
MPANASPNAPAASQADRSWPRSRGRHTMSSSTAAMVSRRVTAPATPVRGNSSAAIAEPNCTDSAPPSTSPTATTPPCRAGAVAAGVGMGSGVSVTRTTVGGPLRSPYGGVDLPMSPVDGGHR